MIVYLYCKYKCIYVVPIFHYKRNNSKNVYSYPIGINTSYQYINNIH